MEILATSHKGKKGIYLWSNQMIFGTGIAATPSEEPIDLEMPSLKPVNEDEEITNDHIKVIEIINLI